MGFLSKNLEDELNGSGSGEPQAGSVASGAAPRAQEVAVCAQQIAVLISGKILFGFFPFPRIYRILSGFWFASGKQKGGQSRWKGLNNFLTFFFPPNVYFSSKISAK